MERIGIVGLGAVGGSLALALRDRGPLLAWSRDAADRTAARAAGIQVCRESGPTWIEQMANTTMVVIAVPLDEVASVARALLAAVPNDALVLHTASMQRREVLRLSEPEFDRVLGTHPIAGSERSGFAAADPGMFRGATIRAEERATEAQRQRIEVLWRDAGAARIAWGAGPAHDELMSWISHLPQLASTALAAVMAEQGIPQREIGPGARDMTRLASSDFAMWAPILRNAPHATVDALRRLTSALQAFGDALEHDATSLAASWEQGRRWRADGGKPT